MEGEGSKGGGVGDEKVGQIGGGLEEDRRGDERARDVEEAEVRERGEGMIKREVGVV